MGDIPTNDGDSSEWTPAPPDEEPPTPTETPTYEQENESEQVNEKTTAYDNSEQIVYQQSASQRSVEQSSNNTAAVVIMVIFGIIIIAVLYFEISDWWRYEINKEDPKYRWTTTYRRVRDRKRRKVLIENGLDDY